jgi:hypothetical protein
MTVAQYNKLSKEEQFECHIKKISDSICFINDKGVEIDLKTDSKIIIEEINKIGIKTKNKTIDKIFSNLEEKYNNKTLVFDAETQELQNKLRLFKKYTGFLVLYLVNYDVKKLPTKYKSEIDMFLDYLEFIRI